MALRWENPASTTHSLTPSPSNRPLIFWILTPRKKPEATGSAGRCELGVGRFTDPHPLTCSFFTPPFCWLMFGLCAPPKILPNPVLCVEKNILFHRGHPVLQCAAFAGPTGSAFSFLLFHSFSHPPLLSGGKTSFLSAGVDRCPRICPQPAHTAPTGQATCFAGVASLPRPLTGQKPPHRAEFGFSPQNEFTPPPKGGGAGYCFSLVVRVLLGSCLWQLLATTGSHASNRACLGLRWCHFLTRLSKSHTGPHRAEFRFHRFFFLDFLGGSPASWRSRW